MNISFDGRTFAPVSNTATGEVGDGTLFHYHQNDDLIWAEYSGGGVRFGMLIAKLLPDRSLDMRYQHINSKGELMTGTCRSTPQLLPDGRLRLHEKWQWTSGDLSSGESVIEEVLVKNF